MRALALFAGVLFFAASANASFTLPANGTANNGGSPGWGMFFDLQSSDGQPWLVTHLSTASTAAAGASFTVDFYTRSGTALGGPVGSGPGSSSAGWTLIGTANATQGPTVNGISNIFPIPNIEVSTTTGVVGVAMIFNGAGPRYFGTGTGPLQVFDDGKLKLTTGDSRSVPFSTTGSFFSPRGLSGSLVYDIVPEPGSIALLLAAAPALLRRRR